MSRPFAAVVPKYPYVLAALAGTLLQVFAVLSVLCAVMLPACLGSLAAARLRLRSPGASSVGRRQTLTPDDLQTARTNFLRR